MFSDEFWDKAFSLLNMETKLFMLYVLSATIGLGFCQPPQGALSGLSTTILCNNCEDPPFWFINGTVYELFSIPRHFPFIPVVDSYSHLIIPYVYLELDQTTFQCARFGEHGLENGTFTQLKVVRDSDSENNASFVDLQVRELVINYQKIFILENMTTVSWFLNDTCSQRVIVQGYNLTGEPVPLSSDFGFAAVGKSASVVISHINTYISYKLEAEDEAENLCPSTRNVYYRFSDTVTHERIFNSSLCYISPERDVCSFGGLNFVWASREAGRSCVCPAHNSSAGRRVFESCVEGCRDAVLAPVLTEQGSICISNLTSSLNGSLFHFVCSTEPCGGGVCFLQTIIASHMVIFEATTGFSTSDGEPSVSTESQEDTDGSSSTKPLEDHTIARSFEDNTHLSSVPPISNLPFQISVVFAVTIAALASVIIAVLLLCVLKYRNLAKQLKLELSSRSTPPPPLVTSHDPAVLPVPIYEEIEENKRQDALKADSNPYSGSAGKQTMKTDYEFTYCPAYAPISRV